jgi:tetratricopeptide (TPR) repeat protein
VNDFLEYAQSGEGAPAPKRAKAMLLAQALELRTRGRYVEAAGCYAEALTREETAFEAAVWRADCLVRTPGRLEEAHDFLEKLLQRFDRAADLYAARAVVALHQGEREGALSFSDVSLQYDAVLGYRHLARVEILLASGARHEHLLGFHDLRRHLGPTPPAAEAVHAALILQRWGHAEPSLEWLEIAQIRDPENAYIHVLRGRSRLALEDVDKARRAFRKALTLDPACPEAKEGLAKLSVGTQFLQNLQGACRDARDWAKGLWETS